MRLTHIRKVLLAIIPGQVQREPESSLSGGRALPLLKIRLDSAFAGLTFRKLEGLGIQFAQVRCWRQSTLRLRVSAVT